MSSSPQETEKEEVYLSCNSFSSSSEEEEEENEELKKIRKELMALELQQKQQKPTSVSTIASTSMNDDESSAESSIVIFTASDKSSQEVTESVVTKEEEEVEEPEVMVKEQPEVKPEVKLEVKNEVVKKQKTIHKKKKGKKLKKKKNNNLTGINVKAVRAENKRLKGIEAKEAAFKKAFANEEDQALVRRILDWDPPTKTPLVLLDAALAELLKPYQLEGIQFMYNSVVGSVEELQKKKNEGEKEGEKVGGGCILAHAMGLGKTLQVYALLHALLTSPTTAKHFKQILIIVPYNVVENWAQEFEKWNSRADRPFPARLFEMRLESKMGGGRARMLQKWTAKGGVLLISGPLFANIIAGLEKMKRRNEEDFLTFSQCLLNPGPQLVVVDEGHLMKNQNGQLARALGQISTPSRILLTGTPLQNNLAEYFTMVNYVRPQLLGVSRRAFVRRFQRPIERGQTKDCGPKEVTKMRRLTKALIKLLKGTVHRKDHAVLAEYLPPKAEFVLTLSLTEVQVELYKRYLDMFAGKLVATVGGLDTVEIPALSKFFFRDKSLLSLVWSHPFLLHQYYLDSVKALKKAKEKKRNGNGKRQQQKEVSNFMAQIGPSWYRGLVDPALDGDCPELSHKTELLFAILDAADALGDKVVVFSQSLLVLDLLERFLSKKVNPFLAQDDEENTGWHKDADYFRIDGAVDCDDRAELISCFNAPQNRRARLMLVSTRAGGLGVNLVGANRAVLFDASFNPATDLQAVFRVYRLGQNKPVFIYRLISYGTMEAKVYKRQVQKQSLSRRVVDEHSVVRHYKAQELEEMYKLDADYGELEDRWDFELDFAPVFEAKPDPLLSGLLLSLMNGQRRDGQVVLGLHEHDDLLERGGFVEEDSESSESSESSLLGKEDDDDEDSEE